MNNTKLEPWQKAPVKIVVEAISHAKNNNEEDNLIAFLLLDVAAEMLLKTYLGLPKKLTGATTSDDERFSITRKGFHDVVEGVKNSRQGIKDKDLARVEFFHGIRNKLYHQGNGLTVPVAHLTEYIEVLKVLFRQLLKIDLDDYFLGSSMTKEEVMAIAEIKVEVVEALGVSRNLKEKLRSYCELIIEAISPKLLLPSYIRKFSDLEKKAFSEDRCNLIDGEVHEYKVLPRETAARTEIAGWFRELTIPLISDSKFYEILFRSVEAGEKYHIEALRHTLGVKNLEVEVQMVPNIFSVIYEDSFDLERFYYNIVDIIIFNNAYLNRDLDYMIFDIKHLQPPFYDQSEFDLWKSRLDSCKVQNEKLHSYIERTDGWLSHNA
ncbi:MAG: hypothetical protein V7749_17980 [Cocleimonas sp.]